MMNRLKSYAAALSAVTFGLAVNAHAALPTSAATAVADTIDDVVEGGGLMIGLALAFLGIRKVIQIFRG